MSLCFSSTNEYSNTIFQESSSKMLSLSYGRDESYLIPSTLKGVVYWISANSFTLQLIKDEKGLPEWQITQNGKTISCNDFTAAALRTISSVYLYTVHIEPVTGFSKHCRQSNEKITALYIPRTIAEGTRRLPYRRRLEEQKTTVHWGQRKLLIIELEFLLRAKTMGISSPMVVYAGAAPGIHIPILLEIFPDFVFHLYDPAKFQIEPNDKIFLYRELFTPEIAAKYRDG